MSDVSPRRAEHSRIVSRLPVSPGVRDLFVGREAELGRLVQALDRAIAHDGRLMLLVGEPGIGKTRIARELRSAPPRSASRCAGGVARRPRARLRTGRGCKSSGPTSGSSRRPTAAPRTPRPRRCSPITCHDPGYRPKRSRHTRGFSSSRRSRARCAGSVPPARCSSSSTISTGPMRRRCSCCGSSRRSSRTNACSSWARTATSRCGTERARGCCRSSRASVNGSSSAGSPKPMSGACWRRAQAASYRTAL